MATKFLESGFDATYLTTSFFNTIIGSPTVSSDITHGGHTRSMGFTVTGARVGAGHASTTLADSGSRISFYVYIVAQPAATATIFRMHQAALGTVVASIRLTSGGVLQIFNAETAQIGTNGATLNTGQWYRISLAYTITSTTVNRFELFVDGVSSISITNATLTNITSATFAIGNIQTTADTTLNLRVNDFYIDNSSSLTDTGDVWVIPKRPYTNGTITGFTTQIGSGGSSYGSGHTPQVNERALSTTNGWSMVGAGAAVTEEYTIEPANIGDMDITDRTIVDRLGWIFAGASVGELATFVSGGVSSTFQCGTTNRLISSISGSTTYPAGGTDIGIITDTTLSTVRILEAGVVIAFIGPPVSNTNSSNLLTLGAG